MAWVYLTSGDSDLPPTATTSPNSRLRWAREEACHPDALDPVVATYDIVI
jgi:hypothetical protein